MWLLSFSCAFVAGVAWASSQGIPWIAAGGLIVAATAVFFGVRRSLTLAVLLGGCALCLLAGAVRYESSLPEQNSSNISFYNNRGEVTLTGTIADEPRQRGYYRQIIVDSVQLCERDDRVPLSGQLLVNSSDPRPFRYGDTLRLTGELESPPSDVDFDYASYLARRGIFSTVWHPHIETLPNRGGCPVQACLLSLNSRLSAALDSSLPEPEAAVAQSLLLGRRGAMQDSVSDAFNRTGTAHLLAVSGLHLGILLAAVLMIALTLLGRQRYLYVWIAIACVWAYAALTGMRPPVARAAIMATVFLVAELAGRQKHAPTALAFAAAIMVAVQPQLLWHTSFQLSVLAMAGIVLLYQPLRAALTGGVSSLATHRWKQLGGLHLVIDILAATAAATLAVWPLTANTFGAVSVIGLPVSVLTLPVLPFAISSSAATAIVASISPLLAQPPAWVAWLFLTYIVKVVEGFATLSWAALEVNLRLSFIIAYYAFLLAGALCWGRWARRQREDESKPRRAITATGSRIRWAIPPLLLSAALVWSAVLASPDGQLHVIFLDVGQGDATLIVSPSGRTVLVDGGPDGQRIAPLVDQHIPFWDRSLDAIIATQPHADHLGGLLAVVDRYRVDTVIQFRPGYDSLLSSEWERRLASNGTLPVQAIRGQSMDLGDGTVLMFLNPPAQPMLGTSDDTDNNGLVVRVSYGDVSFLLSADVRLEAERQLAHENVRIDSTVLKVAHHGSDTSSGSQFLTAVSPEVAVISVGANNPYGHPNASVVRRFQALPAELYTTAEFGTIEFVTDGDSLWVKTEEKST
jgi:competence protein ComEC